MLLDTRKGTIENTISVYYFLICKGLSIDDVGVPRDTIFREIRAGAGFEIGDFVKRKVGGATTLERLSLSEKSQETWGAFFFVLDF